MFLNILAICCLGSLISLVATGIWKNKFRIAFVYGGTALLVSKLLGILFSNYLAGNESFYLKLIQATFLMLVIALGFRKILRSIKTEQDGANQAATTLESELDETK